MRFTLAIMAAAVGITAVPAQAAKYLTLTGNTGVFGNDQVTPSAVDRSFTDTFDLGSLAAGKYLISGTISSSYQSNQQATQNIDFTSVTLNGTPFEIVSTGRFEYRFVADVLSGASNTLLVSGLSGKNAAYSGTISIGAAVPEPASWAMMLVGFGAIGTAVRRRQKTTVRFA